MDESLNQSMSIKRVSKRIRKVKVKYTNFTIFLLILSFIAFIIQKFPEFKDNNKDKIILTKNIFLFVEDLALKLLIIISLIKYKTNAVILCSFLYFIIGAVMIFYIILNQLSNLIKKEQIIKDTSIVMFIFNIILYFIIGFLLVLSFQLMKKEQRERMKEKYGFKTGEDILRSKNILEESFLN